MVTIGGIINLRSIKMRSDGNNKTYNALKSLKYEVTKEECINHISKSMDTVLSKVWKYESSLNRIW